MAKAANFSKWMQDLTPIIGDVPINQIPIPGSHDSGTYGLDRRAVTQNLTIAEQLSMGIRYFDLRPKEQNGRFYIHHTLGTDNHLATYPEQGFPSAMDVDALVDADGCDIIFAQMRKFLLDNPSEVLILRFQNFESFSEDDGDGTNDFTRLAMLANAYFYINSATHNGVGCQLVPYAPAPQGATKADEKASLRNTFQNMTLNNLGNNKARVIIFFASHEVKGLNNTPFDYEHSNIWPTTTVLGNKLIYEPYWKTKASWMADDDATSVEIHWYPYHVHNIHTWDTFGFYVLQSQMQELNEAPPPTSSGYHSPFISEQCAEYTYRMNRDAQGSLISNNGRNADRYVEWMKAGMTLNLITFDFVEYGDLIAKIIDMYQDAAQNYVKRQLYFAPPGQTPWKIYPRTMCPTATIDTNPWYMLIHDPTTFPFGGDGRIRPDNLSIPASFDFFTFLDGESKVWLTHQGKPINSGMGICGHKTDGSFQQGPTSPYYDPDVNTYVKP